MVSGQSRPRTFKDTHTSPTAMSNHLLTVKVRGCRGEAPATPGLAVQLVVQLVTKTRSPTFFLPPWSVLWCPLLELSKRGTVLGHNPVSACPHSLVTMASPSPAPISPEPM